MTTLVNQVSPQGLPAPGLAHRDLPPLIVGTIPVTVTVTPTQVTVAVNVADVNIILANQVFS